LPRFGESGSTKVSPTAETVESIVNLDNRDRIEMRASDHLADVMTAFSGSMLFVWLHTLWFGVWIVLNEAPFGIPHFDPFPFGFLTMAVSLEAIFLSTFVLISQNRQSLRADRRAKVDLEVNVIAEREVTKIIEMVAEIHQHLGIKDRHDHELKAMLEPTYVSELADEVEEAERKVQPDADKRPRSAADTES